MVDRMTLVATLRISTATCGVGKPAGSLIVPTTDASSNCAKPAMELKSPNASEAITRFIVQPLLGRFRSTGRGHYIGYIHLTACRSAGSPGVPLYSAGGCVPRAAGIQLGR